MTSSGKSPGKPKNIIQQSQNSFTAHGHTHQISALQRASEPSATRSSPGHGEARSLPSRKKGRASDSDSVHPSDSVHLKFQHIPSDDPSDDNSVAIQWMRDQLGRPATSWSQETAHLFMINSHSTCQNCCNLNPNKVSEDGAHWDLDEYNTSDGTPAGVITVQDTKTLLTTAQNGCLFCTIILASLHWAYPKWKSEKTFLYIYLASGLPVVLRMKFGTTYTEPVTSAAAGKLRMDQGASCVISVSDITRPDVEIEIYRPLISAAQLTLGDVAFGRELVPHMGFGEPIPEHSRDRKSFAFIKENVDTCVKNHICGRGGPLPILPERVLWVEADGPSDIRLLEPKNIRAPYIALSYCWGPTDSNSFMTTASNIEVIKTGIDYYDLPGLFQDVVDAARELGIEYIWIDRLCIIQGDDADFHSQASIMEQIYGNATLTIAAASATTEHGRILIPRSEKKSFAAIDADISGLGKLKLLARIRSHSLGGEKYGGHYGKISTRAWIWQERLLAARTVFFTPRALKYECRCYSIWEGSRKGRMGPSWSAQLDNMTHEKWMILVMEFTYKNISRPYDRLPAMEAVMRRIAKSTGWVPFWGLWASELIEGLLWSAREVKTHENKNPCQMNPGHYAPTWSWASVDGPISYHDANIQGPLKNFTLQWDLECRSLNGISGVVRFSGRVMSLLLFAIIERSSSLEAKSGSLRCKYVVVGSLKGHSGNNMRADVPLKPRISTISGKEVTTVVRVPYAENPPTESWAAVCSCLLVATSRLGTECLVLGPSLREPRSWERIGVVGGIPFSTFSLSAKQRIDIV